MRDALVEIFKWLFVVGFILFIIFCIKDLFVGISVLVYRLIDGPRKDAHDSFVMMQDYEAERTRAFPIERRDPTRADDEDPLGRIWDRR